MTRYALAAALMFLAACEPRQRPPVYWMPDAGSDAEVMPPYCLRSFDTSEVIGACAQSGGAWSCLQCSGCTEADGGGEVCSR